jgi:transposase
MSLPNFTGQRSFFETKEMFSRLFATAKASSTESEQVGRFLFFADCIWPKLIKFRPELEKMYCIDNGRPAEEPVRMLAVLILQFMERMPDRQAVEACTYDLRWKLALSMEADEEAFHPTSLVYFRERLLQHGLERLGFESVLEAMREAGYLPRRTKQRLDSTHVVGLVSRMSRLECIRESLRLALEVLVLEEKLVRPEGWPLWWERYVESKLDYRAEADILRGKMDQAGRDAYQILEWVKNLSEGLREEKALQILQRVFEENFEMSAESALTQHRAQPTGAIQNPHNPDAKWSAKSTTRDKEWVGHKVQIAETVGEEPRDKGEPTSGIITSIVTQEAPESDKAGMERTLEEQKEMGLEAPAELYVDGAYVSGHALVQARGEGRELMGPAPASPRRDGRYVVEDFRVDVETRHAICPAGKENTQCSRLEEKKTGKVSFRFEWSIHCEGCLLKGGCVSDGQPHRSLVVGEYHTLLQARREEMKTEEFKRRMRNRNAIEGTQSELVRTYGLRKARYRGIRKVRLQNYMIGAACNIKRQVRRMLWEARKAAQEAIEANDMAFQMPKPFKRGFASFSFLQPYTDTKLVAGFFYRDDATSYLIFCLFENQFAYG